MCRARAAALHGICEQTRVLACSLWSGNRWIGPRLAETYCTRDARYWDAIRRFLSVHYKYNTRIDTPFWQAAREQTDLAGAEPVGEYYQENGPDPMWGQTLGKRAVGVIVRDVTERPLSIRQAVLRDAVPIALSTLQFWDDLPDLLRGRDPLLPGGEIHAVAFGLLGWVSVLWFAAEVVTMLTNRKRRAVHDFIAGSVVLRRSALPPNAPLERTGGDFIMAPDGSLVGKSLSSR